MFGLGSNKRRVRSDTFGSNRLRSAALAGIGMLAWRWWRNRQATGPATTNRDRRFSEPSPRSADVL